MSLYPVTTKEFALMPEGTHVAVCKHEGKVLGKKYQSEEAQVQQRYVFQIVERVPDKDMRFELHCWKMAHWGKPGDGKNSVFDSKYNQRVFVRSWLGKKDEEFTDADVAIFDTNTLLGKPCQLTIVHKPNKAGKMQAVVVGIKPLSASQLPFRLEYYTRDGIPDADHWDEDHRKAEEWEAAHQESGLPY